MLQSESTTTTETKQSQTNETNNKSQQSLALTSSTIPSSKSKPKRKLTEDMVLSMPSLSLVLEMGFSLESIEHALNELGENTQPERLVSWLLQHSNVQVCCI